jgi:hypothetical protein
LAQPLLIHQRKKKLTNYVNGISYPENYIFQIESIYQNESYTSGFVNSSYTGHLKFSDLEHGMKIKGGDFIKKINTDFASNRESFYFLHIPKTSGISVLSELKGVFAGEQNFMNTMHYVNESDMLNSKLISGHFAMYPFFLYKKNNKKINGLTIVRDPIDRAISYFNFRYKVSDSFFGFKTKSLTSKNFDIFLSDETNLGCIANYQTKTLTSGLKANESSSWVNQYMNGKITRFELITAQVFNYNFMDLNGKESYWKESLNNFSLIGSVKNRDLFLDKASSLLMKKDYRADLRNVVKNKSDFTTEEVKKILTKDQINRIIELNQHDFELYDFIISNGGVFEC